MDMLIFLAVMIKGTSSLIGKLTSMLTIKKQEKANHPQCTQERESRYMKLKRLRLEQHPIEQELWRKNNKD
jgi:hypothetical protein